MPSNQNRLELAFQRFGSGQPLIILHGLLGYSDNWRTVSQRLSDRFEVFALDLRNHGDSPHEPLMDYRLMADDVFQFMHLHGLKDAAVMGHSMGGKVAMQFALTRPEVVRQLIVVDVSPFRYEARHDTILEALQDLDLREVTSRNDAEAMLAGRIPQLAVRQFLLKNLTPEKTGKYRWKMNLGAIVKNYPAINDEIPADGTYDGPTLFIRGENSDYITDDDCRRIKQFFPGAEMATITGAGHWVHAEKPDEFVRVVSSFLSR